MLLWFLNRSVVAVELQQPYLYSSPDQPFNAELPFRLEPSENRKPTIALLPYSYYALFNIEAQRWLELLQYQVLSKDRDGMIKLQSLESLPEQDVVAIPLLLSFDGDKHHQVSVYQFGHRGESITWHHHQLFGPIAQSDTLDSIAMHYARKVERDYLIMMYAIYMRNPHAFYRNNMNNIRVGKMLAIPSELELDSYDKQYVYQQIKVHLDRWQQSKTDADLSARRSGIKVLKEDMQRLTLNNEHLQQQRIDLNSRIRNIETQLNQVVTKVLGSDEAPAVATPQPETKQMLNDVPPSPEIKTTQPLNVLEEQSASTPVEPQKDRTFPWLALLIIISMISWGLWRYRREVLLWIQHKTTG